MKTFMFIVIFFLVGAFFLISENNLQLQKEGNFQRFSGLYFSWISHIFDNGKSVAGYVVKMDWLPENRTGQN